MKTLSNVFVLFVVMVLLLIAFFLVFCPVPVMMGLMLASWLGIVVVYLGAAFFTLLAIYIALKYKHRA